MSKPNAKVQSGGRGMAMGSSAPLVMGLNPLWQSFTTPRGHVYVILVGRLHNYYILYCGLPIYLFTLLIRPMLHISPATNYRAEHPLDAHDIHVFKY